MSVEKKRQPLTRAEQLRQKHQQTDSQKRPVATRTPAPRNMPYGSPAVNRGSAHVPPVTSRTNTRPSTTTNRNVAHVSPVVSRSIRYGTPLRQSVNAQPRRKVYYAVGANGVETRMPALPIIHFNWQWVSGFLTLGCLVLALLLTNLSVFKVNIVNTEGMQRISVADLQPIISRNASSIFTFNTSKTLNAIALAFPELKNIHLSLSLPNVVTVSANERQPIMAWQAGDQVYWIDAEGVVMQPRGEIGELLTVVSESVPPLTKPVEKVSSVVDYAEMVMQEQTHPLTPEESINYMDPAVLKAAIQMSALMPQGATLVYDPISGIGWNDPGGWKVYFGDDLADMQFKQIEYQAIMQQLANQGISPVMVSVKHVDSPYYRTE